MVDRGNLFSQARGNDGKMTSLRSGRLAKDGSGTSVSLSCRCITIRLAIGATGNDGNTSG